MAILDGDLKIVHIFTQKTKPLNIQLFLYHVHDFTDFHCLTSIYQQKYLVLFISILRKPNIVLSTSSNSSYSYTTLFKVHSIRNFFFCEIDCISILNTDHF